MNEGVKLFIIKQLDTKFNLGKNFGTLNEINICEIHHLDKNENIKKFNSMNDRKISDDKEINDVNINIPIKEKLNVLKNIFNNITHVGQSLLPRSNEPELKKFKSDIETNINTSINSNNSNKTFKDSKKSKKIKLLDDKLNPIFVSTIGPLS